MKVLVPPAPALGALQEQIDGAVRDLILSLPGLETLSSRERRGLIARYAAVLEGNFISWMTGAYLSVTSGEARSIIQDNLLEEVRDNHPGMLRRFALAADAVPTDSDAWAVYRDLENVRQFVGRLSALKIVAMMAFFEGFICKFMPYLATLAREQGSTEMEYTDVHGVADVAHTQGLFQAIRAELALMSTSPPQDQLLEGVALLRALIQRVIHPSNSEPPAPHAARA